MGWTYQRREQTISPQVYLLPIPPEDAEPSPPNKAEVRGRTYVRSISVSRVRKKTVRIDQQLGNQAGEGRRSRRMDVKIDPGADLDLQGVIVSVNPDEAGQAVITTSGTFNDMHAELKCDGTIVEVGNRTTNTTFGFPDW